MTELEKLDSKRASILKKYKSDVENEEMSWKKGQLNYDKEKDIARLFDGYYNEGCGDGEPTDFQRRCGKLFKASKLNTEILSESDFNIITKICDNISRKEVDVELDTIVPDDKYEDYKLLFSKLKKTAIKLRVSQYKRDALHKIRSSNDISEVIIRSKR